MGALMAPLKDATKMLTDLSHPSKGTKDVDLSNAVRGMEMGASAFSWPLVVGTVDAVNQCVQVARARAGSLLRGRRARARAFAEPPSPPRSPPQGLRVERHLCEQGDEGGEGVAQGAAAGRVRRVQ